MPGELAGLLPPIVTPFVDEEISYEGLEENLRVWNKQDVPGYVILGSTGEFVHCTMDEKFQILAAAREHIPEDRVMVAGVGADTTRETIGLAGHAGLIGADYVLVAVPDYYKPVLSERLLTAYYTEIADESPLPVLLYNVPALTAVPLPIGLVAALSEHPNIVGIKDSTGDSAQVSEIVRLTPPGFRVLVGSGTGIVGCIAAGAHALVIALGNVAPKLIMRVLQKCEAGDYGAARQAQAELSTLSQGIIRRTGIGGIKVAMEMVGLIGGQPRRPLLSPTDDECAAIRTELENAGLLHSSHG
ncbi:MAG: dihydrodipicolinate synthase family protein [Candidatus Latescibacteria bacterium]|jgi:4-hydroxy-2-oxoglutarate aldolase|nr:dihydrodipicolinate synthase family protein [Candidatus Latescibacterota bacterium]